MPILKRVMQRSYTVYNDALLIISYYFTIYIYIYKVLSMLKHECAKLALLSIQTIDGWTEGNCGSVHLCTYMTFYTPTPYICLLWVFLQCWNKSNMTFFSFLYFLNFLQGLRITLKIYQNFTMKYNSISIPFPIQLFCTYLIFF